jgi:hypothetical protein
MSTTNNAILKALRTFGYSENVLQGGAASAQGTATKINNLLTRVNASVASGSFVLPSLLSQEATTRPYYVVNDTAGTILVYPALGETMAGSANASQSITTGISAVFFPVHETASGNNDWRPATIS